MNKETYRLWYEFLKRSDDYADYCKWIQKVEANPSNPPPLPEKFKSNKEGQIHHIVETFLNHGDVHTRTFEDFFKKFPNTNNLESLLEEQIVGSTPVMEFGTIFDKFFRNLASYYKKKYGRDPTIYELKNIIDMYLKNSPDAIVLKIDFARNPTGDLIEPIKKKLKEKREKSTTKKYRKILKQFDFPTSIKIDHKKLKLYLTVYDLRKSGYENEGVIRKIGTKEDIDSIINDLPNKDDTLRKYRRYKEKAEKIIENVEKGYFPGNY